MDFRRGISIALAAISLGGPMLADAAAFPPAFDLQLTAENTPWFYSSQANREIINDVDGDAGDVWGLNGSTSSPTPGLWDLSWNLQFDPDPFITGSVTLTNLTGVTQNFTINLSLPVTPALPAPTQYKGSIIATVTDQNGSGAAALGDYTGNGIYAGRIDGTDILPLFGFAPLQCGPTSVGCSANASDYSAGFPGWITGGPAVNSTIGTTLKFSLTAGDRVTFNTLFEVTAVPVPAAVWLLGSALLGIGTISRRRKSL